MALSFHARNTPDKPAFVDAVTGQVMTFAELASASIRLGHALRSRLSAGDHVALMLDNGASYFVASWACRRSGLYFIPINWHLGAEEAAYIVENGDARALIVAPRLAATAQGIAAANGALDMLISDGEAFGNFAALDDVVAGFPDAPAPFEPAGAPLCYSSGTTGRPKGIWRQLSGLSFDEEPVSSEALLQHHFGADHSTVYYHPSPMYHTAPLLYSMGVQSIGGTVVVSPRFDAEEALRVIEAYGVSHAQFVPTHFVRLLQLPDEIRRRYGHASLRQVIHSAAPCPPDIKHRMIDWWGPILSEYYASSEGGGCTLVHADEWLQHPGTVGRSITGPIHILDDDHRELPAGQTGHIAFENGIPFDYYKDARKTKEFVSPQGWALPGDMGWLDEDGFLYLADRSSHMIISGGVNIYPQESEAVLILHPAVRDVAVIGVPDPVFGESVRAVVELVPGMEPSETLASDLIAHCRSRLASYKCPKLVDFTDDLPRLPTGKLLKRELRKRYWGEGGKLIA